MGDVEKQEQTTMAGGKEDKAAPKRSRGKVARAKESSAAPARDTIEAWARRLGTPAWALAGLKVACGWGAGKVVTETEYTRALGRYIRGPMKR